MTKSTLFQTYSIMFAMCGIDAKKVELTSETKIRRLFIDIPKDSWDYHIADKGISSTKEFVKSLKDKLILLGLMEADGELLYKEKDICWTKELQQTYGKNNKDVFYNMVIAEIAK